ncbi:MAG: hypothetical protein HY324_03315 [Chlamydiia bacterium]|nr:hypothetical protein [Chlamydiia bacterium]
MRKCILSLCIASACASGHTMMTLNSFHEIPLGTASTEVVSSAGEPYAIHKKEDGAMEYEYIEKIRYSSIQWEERRYYLLIKDGKVVSKRVEQSSAPPYIYDSYDMQTTQTQTEGEK